MACLRRSVHFASTRSAPVHLVERSVQPVDIHRRHIRRWLRIRRQLLETRWGVSEPAQLLLRVVRH